jgi:proteasome lid subunit RPN8/RPN11
MGGGPLRRLRMGRELYEAMLADLARVAPQEGCGLIATEGDRAVKLYPGENIERSRVRYTMDPRAVLLALLEIEAAGWRLGAIYHSHPAGPPHPSPTDQREARVPDALAVIVSLADPAAPLAAAFAMDTGEPREVPLVIE